MPGARSSLHSFWCFELREVISINGLIQERDPKERYSWSAFTLKTE